MSDKPLTDLEREALDLVAKHLGWKKSSSPPGEVGRQGEARQQQVEDALSFFSTPDALASAYVLACEQRDAAQSAFSDAALEVEQHCKRADNLEAQLAQVERERDRLLFIAEHLFQMIPCEVWRDQGGDDGQGHYEGDYYAEQLHDELAALHQGETK